MNPTWNFHIWTALHISLFVPPFQGINFGTDVIFYLQQSYSLHECLLRAPLKETSQGWNCAKAHNGCLLPYYFNFISFLATIACFWECIKWQNRTLLLKFCVFYFKKTEKRSPSCNFMFVSFILQGSERNLLHLLFFLVLMGKQTILLALLLLYFSCSHFQERHLRSLRIS